MMRPAAHDQAFLRARAPYDRRARIGTTATPQRPCSTPRSRAARGGWRGRITPRPAEARNRDQEHAFDAEAAGELPGQRHHDRRRGDLRLDPLWQATPHACAAHEPPISRWPHTEPALQRTTSGLRKRGPVGTWVIVGEPRMGVADIWPLSSNSAGTEINPGAFSRDGRIP